MRRKVRGLEYLVFFNLGSNNFQVFPAAPGDDAAEDSGEAAYGGDEGDGGDGGE